MTPLADRAIAALRAEHDATAFAIRDLDEEQLTGRSAATEWTVADVLSHLGSAAVITLAGLRAALGSTPAPAAGFNESVWDEWNAMSPAQQRAGYLEHDAVLLDAFEGLDQRQRDTLEVQPGFAPAPLSVAAFAGLRLHESAQHSWDIRASREPAAGLSPESAAVIAELFSGELGFLLGFLGKGDKVDRPVLMDIVASGYGLSVTDSTALVSTPDQPTASFSGPLEAAIRLIAGRLGPVRTPEGLTVTGNVTLEELRRVFPGF